MSEETTNNDDTQQQNYDDTLPDWAREKLTKANSEAAKARHEKKDAVEAAKAEVSGTFQEKVQELEAQIEATKAEADTGRLEVDKLKATIEAGISADKALSFADLLKGDNEEELRSHAEELKKLFGSGDKAPANPKATDPSQGNVGDPLPLNGDPLLDAVTRIVGNRRR